jgi:dethiobiotin synthetase
MLYFVTGTDTNVGKTVATAVLVLYYASQGKTVGVVKAIQTGNPPDNDCDVIRKLTGLPKKNFFCPLTFKYPLAPQQAAELDKQPPIDTKQLIREIEEFAKRFDICLIEGAGGVYVPIRKNYYMLDLIKELRCPTIIVSRTGLGTVNHTLLTVKALQGRRIKIKSIVFNAVIQTKDISAKLNPFVIAELTGLAVAGVIPYQPSWSRSALRRCCRDWQI